ncbi:MAG: hypothetical protein U0790_09400 [Isosphaeraceae bacterium]
MRREAVLLGQRVVKLADLLRNEIAKADPTNKVQKPKSPGRIA